MITSTTDNESFRTKIKNDLQKVKCEDIRHNIEKTFYS